MKKAKKSIYSRLNMFSILLLSTLLPCFLATLLLGATFLPMMRTTAGNNDKAYEKALLYAVSGEFERLFDDAADAVSAVENSPWIHSLYLRVVEGKKPDGQTKKEVTNALNRACVRSELKSLSFKFYDSSVLYNNRSVVDDQLRYEQIYRDQIQYLFFPLEDQMPTWSSIRFGGAEYLLYQTPFRDIEGGRYKGEINVFFNSDTVVSALSRTADGQALAFRLTDLEGNVLWRHELAHPEQETVTLSQTSSNGRFVFCVDVPKTVHSQTRSAVLPSMLTTLLLSLAISAILSYLLSRAAYRPVQKIVDKFIGTDSSRYNEFVALERVFDKILEEKSEAELSLDQLRPIARQRILGSLLDGTAVLEDSVDSQLDHCQICFRHGRFNVIALMAPFSQVEGVEEESTELAMETLLEHLRGQLQLQAYLYYEGSDNYRILINYDSWDTLQSFISQLSSNCRGYFHKAAADERVFLGVGQVVFSAEEIYRAAEQADTALNVAVLNRLEQPMFYTEVAPELNYDYFYPVSEEVLLSRAITNCNTQTAKELLYAIIEENERRTTLDPKCLSLLYMDLSSTVVRSGQSLGISLPPAELKEGYISLDEIRQRVETMIDDICQQILVRRQKNMNGTEVQILAYIDEHIFDQDLSLNSVAERFGKSSAYISTLFKEQRGTNYNNYVNHQRVMRAVRLLTEDKLDVNTVYPMVGYVSLSTFRRNFNKYAKSNPGDVMEEE